MPTIGSQQDMSARLRAVLPAKWFPDDAPVLTGILDGLGAIWSTIWNLFSYVSSQRRISTATGINLDLIATDFLGNTLQRKQGESDTSYRGRLKASIFLESGTRSVLAAVLTSLTGSPPRIFEPRNASDTGGRGVPGSMAYGSAGAYGSYRLPFQCFVETTSPSVAGVGGVQGYGSPSAPPFFYVVGGYGAGSIEYSSGPAAVVTRSDQDVYEAINAVKPIATIVWVSTVATSPQTPPPDGSGAPELDVDFILDVSRLS